jgi:hypothetical protein
MTSLDFGDTPVFIMILLLYLIYKSGIRIQNDFMRKQLNLSARAYHRILKLAPTIADPAGCEENSIRAFGRSLALQAEADDWINFVLAISRDS